MVLYKDICMGFNGDKGMKEEEVIKFCFGLDSEDNDDELGDAQGRMEHNPLCLVI